jgi:hypothetical protein
LDSRVFGRDISALNDTAGRKIGRVEGRGTKAVRQAGRRATRRVEDERGTGKI